MARKTAARCRRSEHEFRLSHEELARIPGSMTEEGRACISLDRAEASPSDESGGSALYTSYKNRRLNAVHRGLAAAPGAKKTAKEYVMIAFLGAGASPSTFARKAVRPAR